MSHTDYNNQNGHISAITGVKLVHEMMVDIIGGLIPGFLFLFSILICVVCPFLCYRGIPNLPTDNNGESSGWFWIVIFLTFLILAYVIGHLFYRSDIKKPDQADLKHRQADFFKEIKKDIYKMTAKSSDMNNTIISFFKESLYSEIYPLYKHLENYKSAGNKMDTVYNENYIQACKKICSTLKRHGNMFNGSQWELEKYNTDILLVLFPELGDRELLKYSELSNFARSVLSQYEKSVRKVIGSIRRVRIDKTAIALAVCYSILHFQNESACATAQRCDFPYIGYYKYLLKRNETELLKYVDWHTDEKRTKNKINKYKIILQMFAPNSYSILNKNESHVRMASSSWHVAKTINWIGWIMLFVTLLPMIANTCLYTFRISGICLCENYINETNCSCNMLLRILVDLLKHLRFDTNMLMSCAAFLFPLSVLILLFYIKNSVTKFIHYQRQREIFHTLYTYNLWKNNIDNTLSDQI